jgi:hypothetical protein
MPVAKRGLAPGTPIFADRTPKAGLRFFVSIEGAFHGGGGKIEQPNNR